MSSEASCSEPPRKRARTSEPDDPGEPKVVRHPLLWLNDGNIVLRTTLPATAVSSATRTLYKVHRSILALNATFFADMFSGGTEALDMASERYEGVPVIDMPDDGADVELFLKAIMVSSWLTDVRRECEAPYAPAARFPPEFAPVLRLATKYGATAIRQAVVDALEGLWPSTLAAWDRQQAALSSRRRKSASGVVEKPHMNAATALRLAYDCNVYSVLPALHYDLARSYGVQGRFQRREDNFTLQRVDLAKFNGAEMARLFVGVSRLHHDILCRTRFPDGLDPPTDRSCTSRTACSMARQEWWEESFTYGHNSLIVQMQDPLGYLNECRLDFQDWALTDSPLCHSCLKRPAPLVAELRAQIWRELPATFDLVDVVPKGWGAPEGDSD